MGLHSFTNSITKRLQKLFFTAAEVKKPAIVFLFGVLCVPEKYHKQGKRRAFVSAHRSVRHLCAL